MPTDLDVRSLRAALYRWYRKNRRDLPWRATNDPYAIWVSEIMLQQTQVATVIPYYERFLDRFPDVETLARASEEDVLGRWSGLGYYRRARALHAGARVVMERHGGEVPKDPEHLRRLPGIGRYTAGAIASVAFGLPEPVLDGNVRRVLSRLLAVAGGTGVDGTLWETAAVFARGKHPGDVNQGLMELGALVCTPRNPACPLCPWRTRCRGHATGSPEIFPEARPSPAVEKRRVAVGWVRRGRRFLLERPGEASPFRGTWDVPAVELPDGSDALVSRKALLDLGIHPDGDTPVATIRHGIMNRRLTLEVFACRPPAGGVAGDPDRRWLDPDRLGDTAVSGATRKIVRAVMADA